MVTGASPARKKSVSPKRGQRRTQIGVTFAYANSNARPHDLESINVIYTDIHPLPNG